MYNPNFLLFLKKMGVKPRKNNFYLTSLTHPTFSNEQNTENSYQKLEFLGDAILEKLVAEYIFKNHFQLNEGQMSILKSSVVKGATLAHFALKEGFDKWLRIGTTKENLSLNKKILEDVFEAFVAALYLDQGEAKVQKFLSRNIFPLIDENASKNLKNPKTLLQEFLQSEKRGTISYMIKSKTKGFVAQIKFDGKIYGKGEGDTKKEAEVNAAKSALRKAGFN